MRRALFVLIAASACVRAAAAGFEELASFRPNLAPLRAAYQASRQSAEAVVATEHRVLVPLPELLNGMRRTSVTFKAGGADVHIFGTRAQNNSGLSGWHIGFAVDGGEITYVQGIDALHLRKLGIGPSRHVELRLNGQLFDLQIKAAVLNWMKSRVVITPKAPGAKPVEFTVAQLTDGAYAAGWPLTLGGREYRLLYTDNINELPEGGVELSGDRVVSLMFRDGKGGISGYGWMERWIPRDQLQVTWTVARGADADGEPGPALGLMITPAGQLDLRYLAPPPAKKR